MDPVGVLGRMGGAARWGDLIGAGVGRTALARAVGDGRVARPIFGTYALPGTGEPVWLAAAYRAQLTCVSLCDAAGLPLLHRPGKIHVVVPDDRALRADDRRPARLMKIHRCDSAWVTAPSTPLVVAIDLASACVSRYAQLALVDAALRTGKLYPGDIREFRYTNATQRRWLIDHCDHEAQSIMESYARVWLTEAGFAVRPQVVVGPRGHRDLLVEGCVVVELDGFETHGKEPQFREDRRLDRLAIHQGKATLRYSYDDLFGRDRADLVADVEAALRLLRKGA